MSSKRTQKWTKEDALAALRYLHSIYHAAPGYLAHYNYLVELELAENPRAQLLPPNMVFKFWKNIREAWRAAGIQVTNRLETLDIPYQFDAAIDRQILEACRTSPVRKKRLVVFSEISKLVGIPTPALALRAVQLGNERRTHIGWSSEEERILERTAHLSKQTISNALAEAGYERSFQSGKIIDARRKVLTADRPSHYSKQQLSYLFGLDSHVLNRWLINGWLQFEMKGTARTISQGGDTYLVTREAVGAFLREYPELYDLRKVNQKWFIELLGESEDKITAAARAA